jgi:hypothetical protein
LAVVGHKQIEMPVVVIITDAHTLAPAVVNKACFICEVLERSVMVIVVQVIRGFFAFGKPIQSPAVQQENVQPSIIIVIKRATPPPVVDSRKSFDGAPCNTVLVVRPAFSATSTYRGKYTSGVAGPRD